MGRIEGEGDGVVEGNAGASELQPVEATGKTVDEAVEHGNQLLDVREVEPRRRLVEDVERLPA